MGRESPAAVIVDPTTEEFAQVETGRLKVDTGLQLGAPDPANLVRERLKNGGDPNMLVDGDASPTTFAYVATGQSVALSEVRFALTANKIRFDGSSFGDIPTLANGVELSLTLNSVKTVLALVQLNEHWLEFYSPNGIFKDPSGAKDAVAVGLFFGEKTILNHSTSDKVEVLIQDDLSGTQFQYFTCTLLGTKVS